MTAACEELPLPKRPVVPARATREPAIAILGEKFDEAVEPSDECIGEPLAVGFRQLAAGRSTSLSKALLQTRTFAMGKSARIAIKAKGRILFLYAADVIAVNLTRRQARADLVRKFARDIDHELAEVGS